jgi:hypothetical protein
VLPREQARPGGYVLPLVLAATLLAKSSVCATGGLRRSLITLYGNCGVLVVCGVLLCACAGACGCRDGASGGCLARRPTLATDAPASKVCICVCVSARARCDAEKHMKGQTEGPRCRMQLTLSLWCRLFFENST